MATTLMKIIDELQAKCDKCSVKDCQSCKEQKMIIRWLKESLPSEETMLRDAWVDGFNAADVLGQNNDNAIQYITNLKKQ